MSGNDTGTSGPGAWDVRRRFAVVHPADETALATATERLRSMPGVCNVSADGAKGHLTVVYDIRLQDYGSLCATLADAGVARPDTWWSRTKARWLQNLDETGRENARTPAAPCCNSAPGIPPVKRR